jgi:Flp pilus assembly protein TadG
LCDRGQALVEFALVITLFVVLVLGVVQFGSAYNNYLRLTDAVRVGGRAAATQTDPTAACTQGKSAATTDWGTPTYSCTQGLTISGATASDPAVQISGSVPFSINILGLVAYSGNLTSSQTERLS